MPERVQEKTVWWGAFTLDEGQAGCWRVGPSTLWIYHLPQEWRLVHVQDGDSLSKTAEVTAPLPEGEVSLSLEDLPAEAAVSRFSFRATGGQLAVTPALADRPVVVRPETPLYVPPSEAATLYVSTPLWVRPEAGDPPRLLQEVPSHRPSDTWYGPNTREGELCYATRTAGRLVLADLPLCPHRAVTSILIRNRARDALLVERIQLPVQYLALFQAAGGYLWTQAVTLDRERDGGLSALHVVEGAPSEAAGARPVSDPRETSRASLIGRTFSTLFHKIREA